MTEYIDIDINNYSSILEQITPFVELDDKQYGYNDIKLDTEYIKGGLLGWMGIDFTSYRHLVIVSNNPFLGDNLIVTLPIIKYFSNINSINKLDIFLPFSSIFKSNIRICFLDVIEFSLNNLDIGEQSLLLSLEPIDLESESIWKGIKADFLTGLNDRFVFYKKDNILRKLDQSFCNSLHLSQSHTEGVRKQLDLSSRYRFSSTFDAESLITMVHSYLQRTNQNWDNHPYWGKIFNKDLSGANDALYSNVYEYGVWMFKLLLGVNFKWINFQDLIAPENFSFARNENLSQAFSPFVLVNINVNTAKLSWQNPQIGIIQYISAIVQDARENNYKVIFTHPAFDDQVNNSIYDLFSKNNENVRILSPDDLVDWIPFMKKAKSIVSFDTGFVHLAYLYNNKVLSVGGQSFFWHFPDTDYINFNHIDNQGNVNSDVFYQSLGKVLNWIKND